MWKGTNSTPKEVQGAQDLARILQVVPTLVDEGEEEGVMEDRCQELLILQRNALINVCFKSQMHCGKCWGVKETTVTAPG